MRALLPIACFLLTIPATALAQPWSDEVGGTGFQGDYNNTYQLNAYSVDGQGCVQITDFELYISAAMNDQLEFVIFGEDPVAPDTWFLLWQETVTVLTDGEAWVPAPSPVNFNLAPGQRYLVGVYILGVDAPITMFWNDTGADTQLPWGILDGSIYDISGASARIATTLYRSVQTDQVFAQRIEVTTASDCDGDGFLPPDDCNDADAGINPDATELCDGIDQNCDGEIDEGALITWYFDLDQDGYGDPETAVDACEGDPIQISQGGDCDDEDPAINPGVFEAACATEDINCDGVLGNPEACDGAEVLELSANCGCGSSPPATKHAPVGGLLLLLVMVLRRR